MKKIAMIFLVAMVAASSVNAVEVPLEDCYNNCAKKTPKKSSSANSERNIRQDLQVIADYLLVNESRNMARDLHMPNQFIADTSLQTLLKEGAAYVVDYRGVVRPGEAPLMMDANYVIDHGDKHFSAGSFYYVDVPASRKYLDNFGVSSIRNPSGSKTKVKLHMERNKVIYVFDDKDAYWRFKSKHEKVDHLALERMLGNYDAPSASEPIPFSNRLRR